MDVLRETWLDIETGHVVVREPAANEFLVSWYPFDENDPGYPGHTLARDQLGVPRGASFEDVVEWAFKRYSTGSGVSLAA